MVKLAKRQASITVPVVIRMVLGVTYPERARTYVSELVASLL